MVFVSWQQIKQMIAEVDKDGSGAIDFDEFCQMMTAKIGERESKEELQKAFQIIDQDNNVSHGRRRSSGYISCSHLPLRTPS